MIDRASRPGPDLPLLAAVAVLLVIGLDMVYSSSYVVAHNDPRYGSDAYFLGRQLFAAALGGALLVLLQMLDYHLWRRVTVPILAGVVVLLFAVLVSRLGHAAYGAQRWLQIGPLPAIQPSEFAKLGLVIYVADWLSRRPDRVGEFWSGAVPFVATLGLVCGLVVLQPDVGSAFVIGVAAVGIYFVAGADLRYLALGLVLAGLALVPLVLGAAYRAQRIAAFLDPSQDPLGIGWNVTQAEIALGSGGMLGLGLGASRQKFYYLPNASTDAIFAVIGEELGLLGTLLVLGLFCLIAYRGFRIALRARDTFGALLATGVTLSLVTQAFVNVGVVTATLPFTGIPLPFVSYGGSSLVVSLASIGLLLSVSRQPREVATEHRPRRLLPWIRGA